MLAHAAVAGLGRIDILVNNASIRRQVAFTRMSHAERRANTGVVLDGAFLCSRSAVPRMIAAGGGVIVDVGRVTAGVGAHRRAHVSAAKAGLEGPTRALAVELAGHGIRVNCVVPGRIGGERSKSLGEAAEMGTSKPLIPRPGEIAEASGIICVMCLPISGYMTGQTVHVSGGLYMN